MPRNPGPPFQNFGYLGAAIAAGVPIVVEGLEDPGSPEIVDALEIDSFRLERGTGGLPDRAILALRDRDARAVLPFDQVRALIERHGDWIPIGKSLFINAARIRRAVRIDANDYEVFLEPRKSGPGSPAPGRRFAVSNPWAASIARFVELPTLQHVVPFSRPSAWMLRLGVRTIEKNIRFMTVEELRKTFSDSSGHPVISDLIVNFIWQQVCYIHAGHSSPVADGNVRALWYLVKPVLSHLGALDDTNHYKTLSEKLSEMVSHKILSYADFGLIEDGKWQIGQTYPHVIIMAEKESHFRPLQKILIEIGATIIATGGQPSTITSEYFTTALEKVVPGYWKPDAVIVIALVDYDPFGYLLLDTFAGDLRTFGIRHPKVINLSVPKNYTPDELAFMHYDLATAAEIPQSTLRRWMKKTHGIDGHTWGMEVDVLMMDRERVKRLVLAAGKPYWHIRI